MKIFGDRIFAFIVLFLVVGGLAIFSSAALGLLARVDATPGRLAITQLLFGLIPGIIALIAIRFAPPQWILRGCIPFYLFAICATLLVFVDGIGFEAKGAARWIDLGFTTVQPGELLKPAVILMLAAYLAKIKDHISDMRRGLLGYGIIVGIPALILLAQPNTSTVLIIGVVTAALYFLAGAPLRDFAILALIAVVGLSLLVWQRPYLMDRVTTYIDPSADALGNSYQIQQSLIAIGSGGIAGRGFGQSVQKFNYLPEPVGDSVFAVYGEEFGFVGAVLLILLFTAFAARGFMIAAEASTMFGSLAAAGLTMIIAVAAFMNIGAMLGLMPLTGLPLPFVSHGGTALLVALASVGVILNIAANRGKRART